MSETLKNRPLVSIITINYNQSNVTIELLKTLVKITYDNYEIIVVDNASPNDTPQKIKDAFPSIKLVISNENLGFAGGNNLGIQHSNGKYILLLNNDTEVPANFLQPLVELLEHNETIGLVSPKIKFHWNPELIQYAGYTKMNSYTIRNNSIGYHQKDEGQFDELQPTHAAHGAAMLIPRIVIEKVGMMTEVYFLYYEEHDYSEIVKKAGYKIYYQPKSYILHKESLSTGKNSPLKTYYLTRNRLVFARRNLKGIKRFSSLLFQIFISFPKNIVTYLLKCEIKHIKSYTKAVWWNFTHIKSVKGNPKLEVK